MPLFADKNKVRIANPLYDAVFRYLMEDNLSARMFIGAVLQTEVTELTLRPTDSTHFTADEIRITLTRMDFSATIKDANGEEKLVIIELQKAKYHFQIMRFRKYLGKQYQHPNNVSAEGQALPIYPIYIIGEKFTTEKAPVIRVKRNYYDAATEEIIDKKYEFIESLTHDAVVIQVRWLKENRRTRLERFLSIFDQTAKSENSDGHVLVIDRETYPEEYERILQRLESVAGKPELEAIMDVEDELTAELNLRDRKFEKERQAKIRNAELAEENAKLAEKHAKRAEEQEKQAASQRRRAEEQEKRADALEQNRRQTVKNLHAADLSFEKISEITGISLAEIEKILRQ